MILGENDGDTFSVNAGPPIFVFDGQLAKFN